jgi:hypothetical protein
MYVFAEMRPCRYLLLLAPVLLLAGCVPSPEQLADNNAIQSSGVSSDVYQKVVLDKDLTISDIEALAHAGVSNVIILHYLHTHFTVYIIHDADVKALRAAGVSRHVIECMLHSGEESPPDERVNFPAPDGPYMYGPFDRTCAAADRPFLHG